MENSQLKIKNQKFNIAITGGGTGGHLKIVKVIKETLNKKGIKPIYIGSTSGADKEWFKNDIGFEKKYFLNSSSIINKKRLDKMLSFIKIIKLSLNAKKILKTHNIKAIISVGGYSAAPASFAAIFSNIPLFIHEQNAHIGSLNKILKPFSKRFFNTFLYNDPYPVDEIFFQTARVRDKLKTIIFLGGSQGAIAINDLAINLAKFLKDNNINIIHQTGKIDYKRIKTFYQKNKIEADVFDFYPNLAQKIKKADFAISRAGASTMFELAANQVPTLFIPYPYAAGDHQYYNAKFLENKQAGFVIKQSEINLENIKNLLKKINLTKISLNLKQINKKNASLFIVEES